MKVQLKKKRNGSSRTIIHVTVLPNRNLSHDSNPVRLTNSTALTNSHQSISSQNSTTIGSTKLSVSQMSTCKWANPTDYARARHQHPNLKKKNLFRRLCLITSLIAAVVLTVVLIIILAVCFNKSGIKTRVKPVTNVTLRWKPEGITVAGVFNSSSTGADELSVPVYVTVNYLNNMFIVDSGNHRIQKYLRNATNGSTIAGMSNGAGGTNLYSLAWPSHVIVDPNENLCITDRVNHRLLSWKYNASVGKIITGTGVPGNATNQLSSPRSAAYDASADIYFVADANNHRIMSYAFNVTSGVLVAGGNGAGSNNTQLNIPCGLYFDKITNSFLIANEGSHSVVRWKFGASNWTLLAGSSLGINGVTSTSLNWPGHLTLDPMGNMYVADSMNHRIQLFFNGQSIGITIAGKTGVARKNASLLYVPLSIELDNQLNLYVADAYNNRVQKFLRY